jgi:hypothetical protein
MLVPGQKLWDQLLVSQGGIWVVRVDDREPVFVVKLGRALVKHLMIDRQADLVVATVRSALGNVRVFGFRVYDDDLHPGVVMCTVTTSEDLEALDRLFAADAVSFEFFDDTCLQTLTLRALLSRNVFTLAPALVFHGVEREVNNAVLDNFEDLLSGSSNANVVESHCVSLTFTTIETHSVTLAGIGHFEAGKVNEGDELEQSVEALFGAVLGHRVIRGPRLPGSETRPELCDVLAFGPDFAYSLVVQAKVDGVLAASPARTPQRRKKAIAKNFAAAVSQGKGAVRALRRGARIEVEGKSVDIPASAMERIHVLVVLSEMLGGLDWEGIATTLLDASDDKTFFHVMDLGELQRLVSHTAGSRAAALLEPNLMVRWIAMKTHGTAFLVGQRPP